MLLRKGPKLPLESETDVLLSQAMSLFKFVDEKDVFQQFYSRQLAKRLIFGLSNSVDMEVSMISRMKASCGYEYTNKLQRMITDLSLSSEFSAKFQEHNKRNSGK